MGDQGAGRVGVLERGGAVPGSRGKCVGRAFVPRTCQSCVPTMCSADPNLEPFTQARTDGGGHLWKGHSLRSRSPLWSTGQLQNSPTG